MNLFHHHSVDELHSLIQNSPDNRNVHDVVLDYDGEVLIDPQLDHPHVDLNKFKFRLQLSDFSKRALDMGSASLRYLYNTLLRAWNSESGSGTTTFA
jgi:hypothetical protein